MQCTEIVHPEGPHLKGQSPETSRAAVLARSWCWSVALTKVHLDGLHWSSHSSQEKETKTVGHKSNLHDEEKAYHAFWYDTQLPYYL